MKQIKYLAASLVLILFINLPGQAQSRSRIRTIGQLANAFSDAFGIDRLREMDARYPDHGRFRVIIEYSSVEGSEKRVFKTFGALGRWLKSRESEDRFPWRMDTTPRGCKRGVCNYDIQENLSHNRLYLTKLSYGYRDGRPYLKTIFLLAG